MKLNPYDILFEPVKIGPVTAPNRFYQVPHCTGQGHLRPRADAAVRKMKAEGGWGVVCNQETEIHPTSDLTPFPESRLWDEKDIPALRLMTEAVHEHGSLAGIELVHNGNHAANLLSRAPAFAPSDMSVDVLYPKQARAMDKTDIRNLRRWHRDAARRSKEAGFDIIYVYAGHRMTLPQHFLLPDMNDRSDEYGGSLENRVRLIRELIEETKEEVGDSCAVAFRFAVEELMGVGGMQGQEEGRAVVEMLAELPDLWDVNVSDWANDSATTRFEPKDGFQIEHINFVKELTTKPVVGTGRITSPDMMVNLVNKGVLDLIGAARPSIADPFLPNKIKEGRIDEIRECIGCNICVSSDNHGVPIRCTQNPTMGEEWRRKWHPEKIETKGAAEAALVVGAGPAGLECAMQLARRGYKVTIAEARDAAGGRAKLESELLGLRAWKRVSDNRLYDLQQRGNVNLYLESDLSADDVAELDIPNVFIATGAKWRADGIGRSTRSATKRDLNMPVFTPDDIMDQTELPDGPIVIYDDEQIYIAGVIAQQLAAAGHDVHFATPAAIVSPWTEMTLEQDRIQRALITAGVGIHTGRSLAEITANGCRLDCVYGGVETRVPCGAVVLVTERTRQTDLYDDLLKRGTLAHLELIGDAASPGLIADAVFDGHRAARGFEGDPAEQDAAYFRRELVSLNNTVEADQ